MCNTANLRRIQNEVKHLEDKSSDYEKMFKINMVQDDMYHWEVVLYGPSDSLYEDSQFRLDIRLPNDYPFSAPIVKFVTPIQHLNINNSGNICLDILKDKWSASQNITTVMLSILLLLNQPNSEDPFNPELANLFRTNHKEYIRKIKLCCDKYGKCNKNY